MERTVRIFVTSDLITDQRVNRTATSISQLGYNVVVTGRKPLVKIPAISGLYKVKYIGCFFPGGPLFYLLFNLKIFCTLLFSRVSLIYANDLDTLPGCWLASVVRFKPLVYDSHELFTELPELINRRVKRALWGMAERLCIGKASYVFTVSDGVASELNRRYGVRPVVVRNTAVKKDLTAFKDKRPTLIYQGSLNIGRGVELAVDMMNHLSCYRLIIAGKGDIEISLRKRMLDQKLFDRVEFVGRLNPEDLHTLTCTAWLGLSLEEDLGLNYRYALPNKIFDYIMAQVPVLVSDLPEMRKIVDEYGVGLIAKSRDPLELANQVADFFDSRVNLEKKLLKASGELQWGTEEQKLVGPIKLLLG